MRALRLTPASAAVVDVEPGFSSRVRQKTPLLSVSFFPGPPMRPVLLGGLIVQIWGLRGHFIKGISPLAAQVGASIFSAAKKGDYSQCGTMTV